MMKTPQTLPVRPFSVPTHETCLIEMSALKRMKSTMLLDTPHRHVYYVMLYVVRGEGTHVIDVEPYPLKPQTVYFLSPGQIHVQGESRALEGYALSFSEACLVQLPSSFPSIHALPFFHCPGRVPELGLDRKHADSFGKLFHAIQQEYRANGVSCDSVLRAYLHILLVDIQRLYSARYPERSSLRDASLLRRFTHLVSEHCCRERSVEFYADILNVEVHSLSDIVRTVTQRSPQELIHQELMREAKRLLTYTDMSVVEIEEHLHVKATGLF